MEAQGHVRGWKLGSSHPSSRGKGHLTCVLPIGQEKINLVLSVYPSDSNSTEDCNDEDTEPGHEAQGHPGHPGLKKAKKQGTDHETEQEKCLVRKTRATR